MSSLDSDDWLTTSQVAALLRVHPKHVYRLLAQGLPARRVGSQWRFSSKEIQAWAKSRGASQDEHKPPCEKPRAVCSPSATALLASSDEPAVWQLLESMEQLGAPVLGLVRAEAHSALRMLDQGQVLAACRALDLEGQDEDDERPLVHIHLARCSLGVAVSPHGPGQGRWATVASLTPPEPSAALTVPVTLPTLQGPPPLCFASECEVLGALMRGEASWALVSEPWAHRFGLAFVPWKAQDCELVLRPEDMAHPAVIRLCRVVQGQGYRQALSALGGYDTRLTGEIRYGARAPLSEPLPARPSINASSQSAMQALAAHFALLARSKGTPSLEPIHQLVEALHRLGLRVGGFLQVPRSDGPQPQGYDLVRLSRAFRLPLADRLEQAPALQAPRFCSLVFYSDAFASAWDWLREDAQTCDVLVVDGVSKLELAGGGHWPALHWALHLDGSKVVLLGVRGDQVDGVTHKLGLSQKPELMQVVDVEQAGSEQLAQQIAQVCLQGRLLSESLQPESCP